MARGNWCRGCYLSYYKEYNSNRVDIRDTAKRYQEDIRAHRAANKAALVRALGGACSLCGYSRSIAALDFDHVGPDGSPFSAHGKRNDRKEHLVSVLLARATLAGFDKAIAEAQKCVLVCSNCHRERTFPNFTASEPESLEAARERLARRSARKGEDRKTSETRSRAAKASSAVRELSQRLSQPVERVSASGEVVRYESAAAAGRDGFNAAIVSRVINGHLKRHKGYFWRRAKE